MTYWEKMFHTCAIVWGATFLIAVSGAAHANQTQVADITDHYKTVIQQEPYTVEVCKDVQVPYGNKKEFDQEGAIIGGIIGGVIGNQFGKGSGKEAATGVGALTGAGATESLFPNTLYATNPATATKTIIPMIFSMVYLLNILS